MDDVKYGDLYRLRVDFRGNRGSKLRPVLILLADNEDIYFLYLTTKSGKLHQRKFRPIVANWKAAGLDELSYISIEDPPYIAKRYSLNDSNYIGELQEDDLQLFEAHMHMLGY